MNTGLWLAFFPVQGSDTACLTPSDHLGNLIPGSSTPGQQRAENHRARSPPRGCRKVGLRASRGWPSSWAKGRGIKKSSRRSRVAPERAPAGSGRGGKGGASRVKAARLGLPPALSLRSGPAPTAPAAFPLPACAAPRWRVSPKQEAAGTRSLQSCAAPRPGVGTPKPSGPRAAAEESAGRAGGVGSAGSGVRCAPRSARPLARAPAPRALACARRAPAPPPGEATLERPADPAEPWPRPPRCWPRSCCSAAPGEPGGDPRGGGRPEAPMAPMAPGGSPLSHLPNRSPNSPGHPGAPAGAVRVPVLKQRLQPGLGLGCRASQRFRWAQRHLARPG